MWTLVKHPPETGGHYAVGGYVNDGLLPRRFEAAFGRRVLTLDGPSWSHCDDRKGHVPIEYWQDLGAHPEAADAADHARLVGAAPDILEALQDLFVDGASGVQVIFGGNPIACEKLEAKCRAAIARATGASV